MRIRNAVLEYGFGILNRDIDLDYEFIFGIRNPNHKIYIIIKIFQFLVLFAMNRNMFFNYMVIGSNTTSINKFLYH